MQAVDYDIETLNDLIASTLDSVDGARAAARTAEGREAQAALLAKARAREEIADQLQDHVRALGAEPIEQGGLNLSEPLALLDVDGAQSAIDVEALDEQLRAKFDLASNDAELLPETRSVVEQGCVMLQTDRNGNNLELAG